MRRIKDLVYEIDSKNNFKGLLFWKLSTASFYISEKQVAEFVRDGQDNYMVTFMDTPKMEIFCENKITTDLK